MRFIANFIRFPAAQNFENLLRFVKVRDSLNVGTFLRHGVVSCNLGKGCPILIISGRNKTQKLGNLKLAYLSPHLTTASDVEK